MSLTVNLHLRDVDPATITAVDMSNDRRDLIVTNIGDLSLLGTLDAQLVMVDRVRDALLAIQAERRTAKLEAKAATDA